MYRIYEGRIVQARVIAVAEKVVRVEVFGVETSILARDLAWDWIGDAHERFYRRRRGAGPYSQRAAQQSGGLGHQG